MGHCSADSQSTHASGINKYKITGCIHVFCWISVSFPLAFYFKLNIQGCKRLTILNLIRITGVGIYRAVMLKLFANSTNPTCIYPLSSSSATVRKLIHLHCRGQCSWWLLVHHRNWCWNILYMHASHAFLAWSPVPGCVWIHRRGQH